MCIGSPAVLRACVPPVALRGKNVPIRCFAQPCHSADVYVQEPARKWLKDITVFLDKVNLPKINSNTLDALNQPISLMETQKVLKDLPLHKSPGNDGQSNGYYKAFINILAPHLTNLFNCIATAKCCPKELLEAVIITLTKSDKDLTSPVNNRPISVLNSDIKICQNIGQSFVRNNPLPGQL